MSIPYKLTTDKVVEYVKEHQPVFVADNSITGIKNKVKAIYERGEFSRKRCPNGYNYTINPEYGVMTCRDIRAVKTKTSPRFNY